MAEKMIAKKKTEKSLCSSCSASSLCLPVGLTGEEVLKLGPVVQRQIRFERKEHLFRQHDTFTSFYAVQSGAFKKYNVTEDGREQISEFYLTGELIGLDAVDSGKYDSSVISMGKSMVCEIPFEKLMSIASEIPHLQRQIIKLMSRRLSCSDAIHNNSQALERVASFLINIAARYYRYSLGEKMISLPMSRQEIGNYLGLAVETVSRIFTQLDRDAVITVNGKKLKIKNFKQLEALACTHSF